ncbi:MAG: PAS domain S-box protein [Melioribacteraceae bacterium]|nr:PAS domain S-box protein [Melioribacteraceae bacterium]MCF8356567.1 PAS domain S-box protein [Melioribacteraceae bacterium]MCF8395927.1 PAS domain S-box protein [Melioribacteraceae bacterium]MCF8421003.1 PAS domain S-box protein [Melioribacteraceae bacterium]
MKKIIIELLRKHFESVILYWTEKILQQFGGKLTESQSKTFAENSLNTLIEVIDTFEYSHADQYLIETYNLFSSANLNLLEVSQVFSIGRYSILNYIENDNSHNYESVILLGFIDEIIEQIYARYGVLHQEAQMKEIAKDRDRLARKLEQNQQYLKNILHSSDSAILVVDENERFVSWNSGVEKIFGYTEKEVIGKTSQLLLPDDPKYREELNFIQDQVKKNGFVKIDETERKSKDGRIIAVQLNVTELPGSDGSYAGRTVVIQDHSEVKRLQAQVDQSEKLAVIGQLAAGIAHEIGNPLTAISSLVQILQRKAKEEFFIEQLASIKENIDRISRIVRELVDFSRPPSHEEIYVNITDIVKTALGIVKYDKRVKKVDFITDFELGIPKVKIVPDQLLQVFVNILINALDAIKGEGKIEAASRSDDKYVYVDISDDGCGIDDEIVSKIFDPFFTTKDVGKGTGLGLSVSYGIIKKLNGDIIVNSKINEGSTFTIKLSLHNN